MLRHIRERWQCRRHGRGCRRHCACDAAHPAPQAPASPVTEVSSQAKRALAVYADAGAMGVARHGAGQGDDVPLRAHHRRQDLDQRGQGDADLPALCRAGDQADGQARRHGRARPAAVLHRSRRHGAGAERFPCRARRREPGEVARDDHRDHRETEPHALREQGRGVARLPDRDRRSRPGARRSAHRRILARGGAQSPAILGKTDAEIAAFQEHGKISSETPIYAPLSGTVVQRKIGPGQYVSYT